MKRRELPPPRRAGISTDQATKLPPWHLELFGVDDAVIEDICSTILRNVADNEKYGQHLVTIASQHPPSTPGPTLKRTIGPAATVDTRKPVGFTHRPRIGHDALAPASGRPHFDSSNRNRIAPPRVPPAASSTQVTQSPRSRDVAWSHNQAKPPPPVRPMSPSSPPPIHPTSPLAMDVSSSNNNNGPTRSTTSTSRKRAHSPEVHLPNSRSRSISPSAIEASEAFKKSASRTSYHQSKSFEMDDEQKEISQTRESVRVIVSREPGGLEKNILKRESTTRIYDMKVSQAEAQSDELEEGELRLVEEKDDFLYRSSEISDVH
jgi:hypothetical protein